MDVKARLVSESLADRCVASSLLEWRGFEVSRRGLEKSCGRRRGLPLRGSAVVKLTVNVRDVLAICRHQEALWRVRVAMEWAVNVDVLWMLRLDRWSD